MGLLTGGLGGVPVGNAKSCPLLAFVTSQPVLVPPGEGDAEPKVCSSDLAQQRVEEEAKLKVGQFPAP